MSVALVAARASNGVIGRGLEIPWRVKGEQKLFKQITLGGTLIMGRKTFDSIGRPLPGRRTIIISRSADLHVEGCDVTDSLDSALSLAHTDSRPIFIVGGGDIYRQALERQLVDTVHLTTIEQAVDGDITFPEFPTDSFRLESQTRFESNINYLYEVYVRTESSATQ